MFIRLAENTRLQYLNSQNLYSSQHKDPLFTHVFSNRQIYFSRRTFDIYGKPKSNVRAAHARVPFARVQHFPRISRVDPNASISARNIVDKSLCNASVRARERERGVAEKAKQKTPQTETKMTPRDVDIGAHAPKIPPKPGAGGGQRVPRDSPFFERRRRCRSATLRRGETRGRGGEGRERGTSRRLAREPSEGGRKGGSVSSVAGTSSRRRVCAPAAYCDALVHNILAYTQIHAHTHMYARI